jgi:hypothetical protein
LWSAESRYKAEPAPPSSRISRGNALDVLIGDIRVRSVVFVLDGDLESAGRTFLADLISSP